jgi:hypothetical protein
MVDRQQHRETKRMPQRIRRVTRRVSDTRLIAASGLFQAEWYGERYPDVAAAGISPLRHFVLHGDRELRDPGPRFHATAYADHYPDVTEAGMGPLVHYLRHGRAEGRVIVPVPGAPTPDSPADAAALAGSGSVTESGDGDAGPARATGRRSGTHGPLHLADPEVTWLDGVLRLRCVLGQGVPLEVAISGPRPILERIEPRLEPFLPMALLIAASAGRDLVVDGRLDRLYLRTIQLGYQPLIERLFGVAQVSVRVGSSRSLPIPRPSLRRPRVRRVDPPSALLFSAGVDSLYSWLRLRELGETPRILVNVNAGAHDANRPCLARRFERVQRFADETGASALLVDTNFHEVLDIPHIHAWIIRNLPAAMTLVGAVSGLFSSTSKAYQALSFAKADSYIGNIGPVVLETLAWSRMPVIEIGHEATRYEKTLRVARDPISERYLEICTDQPYQASAPPDAPVNCGRCLKCEWMMLALHQVGRLPRYASQFPLAGFEERLEEVRARQQDSPGQSPLQPDPPPVPTWRVVPPDGL